jgi:hypothetical protein
MHGGLPELPYTPLRWDQDYILKEYACVSLSVTFKLGVR